MGYLARYVHPQHAWWLQAIAVGLPAFSVLVALATGPYLFSAKWAGVVVHGVLIVLVGIRFAPHAAPAATGAGSWITLVTFNANYDYALQQEQPLQALLEQSKPDIVALQEPSKWVMRQLFQVFLPQPIDSASRALRATYDPETGRYEGAVHPVVSRLVLQEYELIVPDDDATRRSNRRTEPLAVRVGFSWQGRNVALYNIHLHSFGEKPWQNDLASWVRPSTWKAFWQQYRTDYRLRAKQAAQLRRLLASEERPFVLCGDFNSTPHEWVYGHLQRGLHDAQQVAGPTWGGTYHARLPLLRIDYVLASPEWYIRTIHTSVVDFSDHRALVAQLSLGPDA